MLERYVGKTVIANAFGDRKYLGRVVKVTYEYLVLQNAVCFDHLESSKYEEQQHLANIEEGVETGYATTILWLNHIHSVSSMEPLLDDDDCNLEASDADDSQDSSTREVLENKIEQDARRVEPFELSVGIELLKLVSRREEENETQVLDISARISRLRREMYHELGFNFPQIRIRDKFELDTRVYQVAIAGIPVGRGELEPERLLAINFDEQQVSALPGGIEVEDPCFSKQAFWIEGGEPKKQAELQGMVVVEPVQVLLTHLREIICRHSHELFSLNELQGLFDYASPTAQALFKTAAPTFGDQQILCMLFRSLLRERLSLISIEPIMESFAKLKGECSGFEELLMRLRRSVIRYLLGPFHDPFGDVHLLRFSTPLWEIVENGIKKNRSEEQTELVDELISQIDSRRLQNVAPVIVVKSHRRRLAQRIADRNRNIAVIDESEADSLANTYTMPDLEIAELSERYREKYLKPSLCSETETLSPVLPVDESSDSETEKSELSESELESNARIDSPADPRSDSQSESLPNPHLKISLDRKNRGLKINRTEELEED